MQYRAVELALIQSDGEVTEDIEKMLAEISDSVDAKLLAIACLFKNAKAEAEAYKEEIFRLKQLHDAAQRRMEKLEEITKFLLPKGESWSNGVHKLSYRESQAVEVEDLDKVPQEFIRIIPEQKEVDKKKAGAMFKAEGTDVIKVSDTETIPLIPGLKYVVRQNLQVK